MSLKIDRVQLEIVIQQDQARQRMIQLEEQMRAANTELRKVKKQFGENSAEYKKQVDVLKTLQQEYDNLYDEIGLANLSLRDLGKRQKDLNAILRQLNPNTELYKQYAEQLKQVNERIKELKGTANETRFSLSKLTDGFNKYGAIAASAIAGLTGITLTMRSCVDEYAKMEEAQSQVIKYTGLSKEAVKELNEEFKQMDTRTPRTRLNELAGDAGKLGISTKEGVKEFVEAADMINVALGEDLGKDAITQIGKLADMFGDGDRSLKENMLAVGSAVNSVAQNSAASEPYLVEFTARMGGVGKQANMAITDIMGFASALDQNMLRSEMASTALSGLIMKLYQEPAKYAKLAGLQVDEFTKLMSEDVNEAVLTFLEALNRLGGMDKLAPVLDKMSLSGAEAAGVISALAGNVDKVRKEQLGANQAFAEGTSVVNEFNVQNSTVQAELDKAKKRFADIRVELGEQLLPVMKYMISTGSLTVKGLSAVVSVLLEYKGTLLVTVSSITAYVTAVKLATMWEKRHEASSLLNVATLKVKNAWLKTVTASQYLYCAAQSAMIGWTQGTVRALKLFFDTIKLNPIGLIASAVVALGYGIYKLVTHVNEADRAMNSFFERMATEQAELNKVYTGLKNAAYGTEQRRQMIDKFNKAYGSYLPNLLSEKSTLEEIKEAYEKVTTAMRNKIAQQMLDEETSRINSESIKDGSDMLMGLQKTLGSALSDNKVAKIMPKIVSYVDEMIKGGKSVEEVTNAVTNSLGRQFDVLNYRMKNGVLGAGVIGNVRSQLKNYVESVSDTADKIQAVKNKLNPFLTDTSTTGKPANQLDEVIVTPNTNIFGTPETSDFKAKENKLREEYENQLNLISSQHVLGLIEEEKYQQQLYDLELKYLDKKRALYVEYDKKQDIAKTDREILAAFTYEANRQYANKLANQKQTEAPERQMDIIEEDAPEEDNYFLDKYKQSLDGQLALLEAFHDAGIISEMEYQDRLTEITKQKEEERTQVRKAALDTFNQLANSMSQLMSAMQESEISKIERRYDAEIKNAQKAGQDTTALEEQKEEAVLAVKRKYADKQFALQVLQVTASTAVAAMEAYKAMAGIPIIGPALGAAAAAAAVIAGAAQIAVAKKQRDEAAGLYSGGYSDDYVQGYTAKGDSRDVAGVIPVHKNEFVTNHKGVANPHVKQFLDVFDVAQRNGTIGMINTTQILQQIRFRGGRYTGGYTDDSVAQQSGGGSGSSSYDISILLRQILNAINKSNEHLVKIAAKELSVNVRSIRDGIKRVEMLERNASR